MLMLGVNVGCWCWVLGVGCWCWVWCLMIPAAHLARATDGAGRATLAHPLFVGRRRIERSKNGSPDPHESEGWDGKRGLSVLNVDEDEDESKEDGEYW